MYHFAQCPTTAAAIRIGLDDIRFLIQVISALTLTTLQMLGASAPSMNKTFCDLPIYRALPNSSIQVYPLTPITLVTPFLRADISPAPLSMLRSRAACYPASSSGRSYGYVSSPISFFPFSRDGFTFMSLSEILEWPPQVG